MSSERFFFDLLFNALKEWESNAPYRRGKKVSAGVVALGLSYRGFLYDLVTIFGTHHIQFARRVCAGILSVALRAVSNLYWCFHS